MFGFDAYALTYAGALVFTAAVGLALGGCARGKGAFLLGAAWLATVAIQRWTGDLAAPLAYALIDFSLVMAFGLIGLLYNRTWAWWVSALHVAMLLTHLAFVVTSESAGFLYLSVLGVLGYACMLAIAGPPLFNLARGARDENLDYKRFMRGGNLPPSAFSSCRKKKDGQP